MQVAGRGFGALRWSGGATEWTILMTHGRRSDWSRVDDFLAREGLRETTAALLERPAEQRLSSLCYIQHAGRVLMLRRLKEPFAGYWTAPGGKLLPGEDPQEAVVREVREETDLVLEKPELRLIASETGPEHYNWLLFFFRAQVDAGSAAPELLTGPRPTGEGLLDWLPADGLLERRLPDAERRVLPYVIAPPGAPPYYVRIRYAPDKSIADLAARPLQRTR